MTFQKHLQDRIDTIETIISCLGTMRFTSNERLLIKATKKILKKRLNLLKREING